MKDTAKNSIVASLIKSIDPSFVPEYSFFQFRKWRFDWASPNLKIAIELNGNAWGTVGGGRHGKVADLQKLNCAQRLGWRVYQYGTTTKELARMHAEVSEHVAFLHGLSNVPPLETIYTIAMTK